LWVDAIGVASDADEDADDERDEQEVSKKFSNELLWWDIGIAGNCGGGDGGWPRLLEDIIG
jgi:hypothetical protein